MKVLDYLNRIEEIEKNVQKLLAEKNALDKLARKEDLLNVNLGDFKNELLKSCNQVKVELDFHFFSGVKTQEDFENYVRLNGTIPFKLKLSTISQDGEKGGCIIENYYDQNTLLSDGSRLIDSLLVKNNNSFVGFISLPDDKWDKLMINIDPIWNVEVYKNNLYKKSFISCIKRRAQEENEKLAKSYSNRRSPLAEKVAPHVRYNPDELNETEI